MSGSISLRLTRTLIDVDRRENFMHRVMMIETEKTKKQASSTTILYRSNNIIAREIEEGKTISRHSIVWE